ncbi:MAG TPA: histidine phosphatase family protein [Stellaceae bacterium]|jgi:phosphohistidine phosphatase
MNTLHLLRHAKSSRKEDVEDHARTLSRRGRETARRVGKHLPAKLGTIDLVLCSSARRTRETLDLVLLDFSPAPRTMIEDELYLASREKLAARLRRLDPREGSVLLIGHNPGLYELAVALADENSPDFRAFASGKFPTAAWASFLISPDWSALGDSRHELTGYVTPASLPGEKG